MAQIKEQLNAMCKQQQVNIKITFSYFLSLPLVKWWTSKTSRGKMFPFFHILLPTKLPSSTDFIMMMLRCQNVNIVDKINTSSASSFKRETSSITRHPREHKEINSRRRFVEHNGAINMNKDSLAVNLKVRKALVQTPFYLRNSLVFFAMFCLLF